MERKKNGQRKGLISTIWLILFYIKQLVLSSPSFVPTLKILCQLVPEKSLTEKVYKWQIDKHKNKCHCKKLQYIYIHVHRYTSFTGGIKLNFTRILKYLSHNMDLIDPIPLILPMPRSLSPFRFCARLTVTMQMHMLSNMAQVTAVILIILKMKQ